MLGCQKMDRRGEKLKSFKIERAGGGENGVSRRGRKSSMRPRYSGVDTSTLQRK